MEDKRRVYCEQDRIVIEGIGYRHEIHTMEAAAEQLAALEDEIDWLQKREEHLRECEEFKLVAFLGRPDVVVRMWDAGKRVVVHHKNWEFEGRAENVISAARMAIHMERKSQAARIDKGEYSK
ncbi:MAG: hypothetical protein ACYTA5_21800 [Planctomycetota bacterium]|jgi:hypothetical protein